MATTPEGFEIWVDPQPGAASLHNVELLWFSACLGGRFKAQNITNTPASPVAADVGKVWIVGAAGTGAWSGHNNQLALWDGSQWLYRTPIEGTMARDLTAHADKQWSGSAWV